MQKLSKLCQAVRTLSPLGQVQFRGIPDRDDWWVCIVSVGDAILAESSAGPLETVLDEATRKIKSMSQRMRTVLDPDAAGGSGEGVK